MIYYPALICEPATNEDRTRAQAIIEKYGQTSRARFTLFEDKSYFFSPNESVIAFVVKGQIALVLGDPIGPQDDVEASIVAFKSFCARHNWQACFYQTQPDYLNIYKTLEFNVMSVGQEAIVDLAAITLEGHAGKEFRNVVNRLTRLGHRVEIYEPPMSDTLLGELKVISDEWLTGVKGSEFRFSVGWFDDKYIRDSIVAVVYTPEGCMSAFTNIVSDYQRKEAVIDLMRRRRKVENGTMDFLFISIFDWAKFKGNTTFSLGFSGLSGIGEKSDSPAVEKALHYLYENMSRFYNVKGLHTFKDKFHPRWESRYMVYPKTANLSAIAIAFARAHNGDDFLWTYIRGRTKQTP